MNNKFLSMTAEELASEIKQMDSWDIEMLEALCRMAGMEEEWESADAEAFESVAFQAAEKLGVDIL